MQIEWTKLFEWVSYFALLSKLLKERGKMENFFTEQPHEARIQITMNRM